MVDQRLLDVSERRDGEKSFLGEPGASSKAPVQDLGGRDLCAPTSFTVTLCV